MDKHEFRLIWMFLGYGVIGVVVLAFSLPNIVSQFSESNQIFRGSGELSLTQIALITIAILQPVVSILAGAVGVLKKSINNTISLSAAIVVLVAFPIGTVIGVYYFWYRQSLSGQSGLA